MIGDLVVVVVVAALVGLAGVGFGIFFVAPRLSRLADRSDEDAGAGDD